MSASVNDLFQKLGGASSLVNTPKVTATRSGGGATLTVDNCNWDQTTGKLFATYQVDTSGNVVDGTQTIWKGVVNSSTSIGSLARVAGASDTGNAIGDYVELLPASAWANNLVDGLLAEHNQDGTHGGITATSLNVSGPVTIKSYDGWITDSHTWTYASGSGTNQATFTVAGVDLTGVYNVGDRVKFTQTTVKYGIIVKTAFSTDTTVSIYMGTDYTMANAAITSPAYSHDKSPVGFPMDITKWTVLVTDANDRTGSTSTPANIGSVSITVPIGVWVLSHQGTLYTSRASSTVSSAKTTLSTGTTTEDDTSMTSECYAQGASATLQARTPFFKQKTISLTSATPYYQNIWAPNGSDARVLGSTTGTTIIKAVCAHF